MVTIKQNYFAINSTYICQREALSLTRNYPTIKSWNKCKKTNYLYLNSKKMRTFAPY